MELFNAREAAKFTRCSEWFIYKHWKALGGVKIGAQIRFPKNSLETILKKVIDLEKSGKRGEKDGKCRQYQGR